MLSSNKIIPSIFSFRFFCVILFLVFLASSSGNSQTPFWQQTNGPYGLRINTLATDSTHAIYVGTSFKGLYRSDDGGVTWHYIGLMNYDIYNIVIDYLGTIYLAVGLAWEGSVPLAGVLRSLDNGLTWEIINNGLNDLTVVSIAVNRLGQLFAGIARGGIYTSYDKGENWKKVGLSDRFVRNIYIDSQNNVYACVDWRGIYMADSFGLAWKKLGDLPATFYTALTVNEEGDIFVALNHPAFLQGGVFRSKDKGATWQPVNNGITNFRISSLFYSQNKILYAGADGGMLFRSQDNGENWELCSSGLTASSVSSVICHQKGSVFMATNGGGLFGSEDEGETWHYVNLGFRQEVTSFLAAPDGEILCGTGVGIFRSKNHGELWSGANHGLTGSTITCFTRSEANIYFTGTNGRGIFFSFDKGNTWGQVDAGLPLEGSVTSLLATSSGALIAGLLHDKGGIFMSFDGGQVWQKVFPNNYRIRSIVEDSQGYLYFGGEKIGRSKDNGASWSYIFSNKSRIQCLCVDGFDNIYAGTRSGDIFRSGDRGENWRNIANLDASVQTFLTLPNNSILAGTGGKGVFESKDAGENWEPLNDGLTEYDINALTLSSDGYLYAGTEQGVFVSMQVITAVEENSRIKKKSFVLNQNYPNPFNATTTIHFFLSAPSKVSIKILDLSGKEVDKLVDREFTRGYHLIEWDATNLPSNIYFYRIKSASFVETKKMILIK